MDKRELISVSVVGQLSSSFLAVQCGLMMAWYGFDRWGIVGIAGLIAMLLCKDLQYSISTRALVDEAVRKATQPAEHSEQDLQPSS